MAFPSPSWELGRTRKSEIYKRGRGKGRPIVQVGFMIKLEERRRVRREGWAISAFLNKMRYEKE